MNKGQKSQDNNNQSKFDAKEQAKNMMEDVKGMSNIRPQDFKPGKTKGMPTALMIIQILLILSAVGFLFDGGVLGIIGTVICLLAVWGVNKRVMWAYWLLIAFVIYSVVVALLDWIAYSAVNLIIDAVLLYYITQSRKWFKESKSE